jgi:hypothetical protein
MEKALECYVSMLKDNERHVKYLALYLNNLVKMCCTIHGVKEWMHSKAHKWQWVMGWIKENPMPNASGNQYRSSDI